MTNKKFIIVEGKDDKIFFEKLVNNQNVTIESFNGKPNIIDLEQFTSRLKRLVNLRKKSEIKEYQETQYKIPKLLITCDADDSYKNTRLRINKTIEEVQKEYAFDVALIYILPLNKDDDAGGDLESLILEIISDSKDEKLTNFKKCAEKFNKCTISDRITQSESKFILHSMLLTLTKHDNRKYSALEVLKIEEIIFRQAKLLELKKTIEKFLQS